MAPPLGRTSALAIGINKQWKIRDRAKGRCRVLVVADLALEITTLMKSVLALLVMAIKR